MCRNKKEGKLKMKRQKQKMLIFLMWLMVGITSTPFLFIIPEVGRTKPDQKWVILSIVFIAGIIVWELVTWLSTYKSRYIEMGEGKLVIVKSTKKLKIDNRSSEGAWVKKKDVFNVEDIARMGYSIDLYKREIEFHQYVSAFEPSYEMVFELKNHEKVTMYMLGFTGKQQKEIFGYIYERIGLLPEGRLKAMAGKKLETSTVKRKKFRNQYFGNKGDVIRIERNDEILYQNELKPLTKDDTQKYNVLWVKKQKQKGWRLPIFCAKLVIAVAGLIFFATQLAKEIKELEVIRNWEMSYWIIIMMVIMIIIISICFQIGAKQVVAFKDEMYQRGLGIIIEYEGKYKPICVRYVQNKEIKEEYFYHNCVDGELQKGMNVTFVMMNGTFETLFSQDISWIENGNK